MTHTIKHLFHIDATPKKVFEPISTIEGLQNWWAAVTTVDSSFNGIIKFRFGEQGGQDMKVVKSESNSIVEWDFLTSDHGWVGHQLKFELDENDGKTCVRFSHNNWVENDDFFTVFFTFAWSRNMESLRQLCQKGKVQDYGTKGYAS